MKIKVTKHDHFNSVYVTLNKETRSFIKSNKIVVTNKNQEIQIREATDLENKSLTIKEVGNNFTYTTDNAKELIGEYNYEFMGDYIILYK